MNRCFIQVALQRGADSRVGRVGDAKKQRCARSRPTGGRQAGSTQYIEFSDVGCRLADSSKPRDPPADGRGRSVLGCLHSSSDANCPRQSAAGGRWWVDGWVFVVCGLSAPRRLLCKYSSEAHRPGTSRQLRRIHGSRDCRI